MKRDIRNVAASKRERLANRARSRGDAFDVVMRRFFFERFLYRLGISPVANHFVLKGAMLFQLWADQPYRATVDLDLLRRHGAETEDLPAEVRSILAQTVEPDDGVHFDPNSLTSEPIRAQDEYAGTRLHFAARLGVIVDRLQVDVGSADSVWPPPQTMTYPSLLDDPAPHVLAYRRETVIAEKSEAMLTLGIRNSRMKDFFDIHYLATHFDFDGDTLCEALRRTLSRRQTLVPNEHPIALTAEFWEDAARSTQLRAFAKRARIEPLEPSVILPLLVTFLTPLFDAIVAGRGFAGRWPPGGPWAS